MNGDRIYAFVYELFEEDEGVITIVSVDAANGYPIKNTKFQLIDLERNEMIEELITGSDGVAQSQKLPQNKSFQIIQTDIQKPYQLNEEHTTLELVAESNYITIESSVHPAITTYKRTDNHEIVATEMKLPVEVVLQEPELPNGCEVTALTSVLKFYGYNIEKTTLADKYLPKVPFEVKNGNLYGADPYQAYAGEPRSKNQGFFSYVPPIVETVKSYFESMGGHHKTKDLTGSSPEQLLKYVREGIPVIVWTTINQNEPMFNYSWYVADTDKSIDVIRNSHTVVLTGFSEDNVYVMDPLKGNVAYPRERFFDIYKKAGSHAMVVH
jgi:uncharacterized protein YvpB